MGTVQLAGNSLGGQVNGNFGVYQQASDGTYTVDTRDAPDLLRAGMSYLAKQSDYYALPVAPIAGASGQIVASATLSNGTASIAHQPDVMRPVLVVIGTGTTALTAGNVALTYLANDGTAAQVDNFSCVMAASTNVTVASSKGVAAVTSVITTGVSGGTSPFLRVDTTNAFSVPVTPNAIDFKELLEVTDNTVQTTLGTVQTSLGSIAPHILPNSTHTYSFGYVWNQPDI